MDKPAGKVCTVMAGNGSEGHPVSLEPITSERGSPARLERIAAGWERGHPARL